jgi:hypothetical protein
MENGSGDDFFLMPKFTQALVSRLYFIRAANLQHRVGNIRGWVERLTRFNARSLYESRRFKSEFTPLRTMNPASLPFLRHGLTIPVSHSL